MAAPPNNQYAKKWTDGEIVKLANDLLQWAATSRDLHFAGWALKHKKTTPWINWLANHYPIFAEAKEEAKRLLARKILNSSFYDRTVNAYVGMQYIGIYDQNMKDFIKWKIEMQKESPAKENHKCIFNDTVKELKADDNTVRE